MPATYPFTQADVYRYKQEFKESTEKARLRFSAGFIVIGIAMIALVIMTLYYSQAWSL